MDTNRLVGVGGAERSVRHRRRLPVGGRRAVFEAVGGFEAIGIDLGIQVGRGCGEIRRAETVDRGRLRS